MNYVFEQVGHPRTSTFFLKLSQPLRKTNNGQNTLSYIEPSIQKSLPDFLKATKLLNIYEQHFLDKMKNKKTTYTATSD